MPFNSFVKGKLAVWQLRQIATQTTSTGNAQVEITPGVGNFFIIDTLRVGADDYTTGITLTVDTEDEDGNDHLVLVSAGLDNVRSFVPSQNVTDGDILTDSKIRYIVIAGDDRLRIAVDAILATHTITIALRAYISSTVPTIAWITSAGTIPQSTTLNKVVA